MKKRIFHWKPLLWGVIGFVVAFVIGGSIGFISAVTDDTYGYSTEYVLGVGTGFGIAGAVLGVALKNKKKVLYLAFAGAVGFAIGGAVGFAIGRAIWYAIGGIWYVIGGAIWYVIGGAALGLALKDKKMVLYLAGAGAIGYAISFATWFAYATWYDFVSDLLGYVVGGDNIAGAITSVIIGAIGLEIPGVLKQRFI